MSTSLEIEPIFILEILANVVVGICYEEALWMNDSFSCSHFGHLSITTKTKGNSYCHFDTTNGKELKLKKDCLNHRKIQAEEVFYIHMCII
jgi:hypothetical protein